MKKIVLSTLNSRYTHSAFGLRYLYVNMNELQDATEILEFKEAKKQFSFDKLGKYFSALSNEANLKGKDCSWFIFGINNDRTIVGTHISEKQLNEYKHEIAKNTSPTMSFRNTYRIKATQGDVIMLEIPAATRGIPVAWKNLYYARDGESLTGLNIDKFEQFV